MMITWRSCTYIYVVIICLVWMRVYKCINGFISRAKQSLRVQLRTPHTLTSPNDVHHSVNLSNTKFITYIYTSFNQYLFEIYVNFFVWIFSKCQFRTFSPVSFRRWTGPPFYAKQNNHSTPKNIVLILYFVTVLCHIVNMSYILNTVQHSNRINVFLSINEEETKTFLNTQ